MWTKRPAHSFTGREEKEKLPDGTQKELPPGGAGGRNTTACGKERRVVILGNTGTWRPSRPDKR